MNAMKRTYSYLLIIWLLAICAAVPAPLAVESVNPSDYAQELVPLKEHQRVAMEIVRNLKKNHYRKLPMDDSLSNKVFDKYLSLIDPLKLYFLTSDLKEFETYRYHLIDAVVVGNTPPAFNIFELLIWINPKPPTLATRRWLPAKRHARLLACRIS